MKKTETISTICRMCDHGCGIEVGVAEGQPVSLKGAKKHPYNKGWLCAKGRAALDFFHHPERLATPLIKKGGKFVPADWNRSLDFAAETASKADIHLPIRPGCDEILILNMLHVIFREKLWDKAFTAGWVNGFNNLFETVYADRFSPENGQAVTGISPDLVREVASAYARTFDTNNRFGKVSSFLSGTQGSPCTQSC